jgi:hypothetical protein
MSAEEVTQSYIIRDAVETDLPFVFSTFLRGLFYGDPRMKETPKQAFMEQYHRVLEHILSLPTVQVKVAALSDDPSVILGYAIIGGEGAVLHWVFCKSAFRKIGIAKNLVPSTITTFTHKTPLGESIIRKHKGVSYNPFLIK